MTGWWAVASGVGIAVGGFALGHWWTSQIHQNKQILDEYWRGEVAQLPPEQVVFFASDR